jgi:nitrate/TMAO reductase-like tetraheme cytochrome c subunit
LSESTPSTGQSPGGQSPGLFHNLISLVGAAIVTASIASIVFLVLIEFLGSKDNPYLGIYTYIMFPAFLLLGLLLVFAGMLRERRRRRRHDYEGTAYPVIDLNDPRRRRTLKIFVTVTFLFLLVSAFGSYRAYEYTESVQFCGQLCHEPMNPEFVAFSAAPHSRIRCVDCHVGSGADWYLRSKFAGARQLYAFAFNKYQRPIPTPVHNLRPARDTCEQCHWPEKYFGQQLKEFNYYGYDEKNTPGQTRMLINTGGGSPAAGPVTGIHWHMNLANEITPGSA